MLSEHCCDCSEVSELMSTLHPAASQSMPIKGKMGRIDFVAVVERELPTDGVCVTARAVTFCVCVLCVCVAVCLCVCVWLRVCVAVSCGVFVWLCFLCMSCVCVLCVCVAVCLCVCVTVCCVKPLNSMELCDS